MGTKKLWSINSGRVWHRFGHKILLPVDENKTYTVIFSEVSNFTPSSVDVVISNEQKTIIYADYPNIIPIDPSSSQQQTSSSSQEQVSSSSTEATGENTNINFVGLNDNDATINASVLINGLQDNINI